MPTPTHPRGKELGDRKPTVRQIYALAAALAERLGEALPATAAQASELNRAPARREWPSVAAP
jgi:hypothetical protein